MFFYILIASSTIKPNLVYYSVRLYFTYHILDIILFKKIQNFRIFFMCELEYPLNFLPSNYYFYNFSYYKSLKSWNLFLVNG